METRSQLHARALFEKVLTLLWNRKRTRAIEMLSIMLSVTLWRPPWRWGAQAIGDVLVRLPTSS